MTAAQILTPSSKNHFEEQALKEKAGIVSKDKTYGVVPIQQPNYKISATLMHALSCYSRAISQSKRDPFQQLLSAPAPHTIVTKNNSYTVTPENQSQLPVSKELIDQVAFKKLDLHSELKTVVKKKHEVQLKKIEVAAKSTAEIAARLEEPELVEESEKIGKEAKRSGLAGYDEIIAKFHMLLMRMIRLSEGKMRDLTAELETRTQKAEKITKFSSKLRTAMVESKDSGGAVNFNDNAEMKAMIDEMRSLGLSLPAGYDWTGDQAGVAVKTLDDERTDLANISKSNSTKLQQFMTDTNNIWTIKSSMIVKVGETAHTIASNIAR